MNESSRRRVISVFGLLLSLLMGWFLRLGCLLRNSQLQLPPPPHLRRRHGQQLVDAHAEKRGQRLPADPGLHGGDHAPTSLICLLLILIASRLSAHVARLAFSSSSISRRRAASRAARAGTIRV